MKYELGRCLLAERMSEAGMTQLDLARALQYKPERLADYAEKIRIMPLKSALSIADTLGCGVRELYELIPKERGSD